MLQTLGQSTEINYAIQPEPCLVPFITPDLVEKYVRADLPNRKSLIPMLNHFLSLQKKAVLSDNFHVYHTLEGIRSFLETGKIYEIPEGLCIPFSPEDRTLLISRLLQNPKKIISFCADRCSICRTIFTCMSHLPAAICCSPTD